MICVSFGRMEFPRLMKVLSVIPFAEIRLDKNSFSVKEVQQIFSLPLTTIATCRPGSFSLEARKTLLMAAVEAGANYIDIGMDNADDFCENLLRASHDQECKVILSYHNFTKTPPVKYLKQVISDCFATGADICKIACQALSQSDSARLLSLYALPEINPGSLVALGMGEFGKITRIAGPALLAPFTYAAFSNGMETANGQLDRNSLSQVLTILGVNTK